MHLSVVPQNRFGDLVEAALRVEQSTTAMYQSRHESKSKRSAPVTSQQSSGQYSRKKSKSRGYRGRGAGRGAISSQGLVRLPVASSGTQSIYSCMSYMSEVTPWGVYEIQYKVFPLWPGRPFH